MDYMPSSKLYIRATEYGYTELIREDDLSEYLERLITPEYFDEDAEPVIICGYPYDPARALSLVDPIAYREMVLHEIDCIIKEGTNYLAMFEIYELDEDVTLNDTVIIDCDFFAVVDDGSHPEWVHADLKTTSVFEP